MVNSELSPVILSNPLFIEENNKYLYGKLWAKKFVLICPERALIKYVEEGSTGGLSMSVVDFQVIKVGSKKCVQVVKSKGDFFHAESWNSKEGTFAIVDGFDCFVMNSTYSYYWCDCDRILKEVILSLFAIKIQVAQGLELFNGLEEKLMALKLNEQTWESVIPYVAGIPLVNWNIKFVSRCPDDLRYEFLMTCSPLSINSIYVGSENLVFKDPDTYYPVILYDFLGFQYYGEFDSNVWDWANEENMLLFKSLRRLQISTPPIKSKPKGRAHKRKR